MQEDDGCSASGFLEIEADFVAGDGIGHLTFLLIGPASKIAINTRGCNEAKSILFAIKYARNHPKTDRTPPHEILLSPCCNAQYAKRMLRPLRTGRGLGV
jgi:hypothetical protein